MARINQSIDAANEQAKQGSLGFINWMLEQSNLTEQQTTDFTRAKKVIEDATAESFDKYAYGDRASFMPAERNNMVTVIGDEKDATSLANLKKSIAIMKKINELRASDDNFTGNMKRNDSLTNFYFMAVAQTGADRGAGLAAHSKLQVSCENLAFGYTDDPTIGWYKKEKRSFDAIKADLGITEINETTLKQIKREASSRNVVVGHYTNLFWAADQLMGVGFTQYRTTSCYNASELSNYEGRYASYTIDEFEALIDAYQAYLDNPGSGLEAAKAALAQAQVQQSTAAENLSAKQQVSENADAKVAQAQANCAAAQQAIADSEKSIAEKQQAVADANAAVAQAQTALDSASSAVASAENEVAAKKLATAQAKQEAANCENALAEAKKETASTQDKKDAAIEALGSLSADLAAAQNAYDNAAANQQQAVSAQTAAAETLMAAELEATSASAALQAANADVSTKQNTVTSANQQLSGANQALSAAQDENARLASLTTAVESAQAEADAAAAAVNQAKYDADAATKAIPAAESVIAQCQQEFANASDMLASLEAIDENDAFASGIGDARFSNLDALYAAARQAQAEADQAKAALDAAEEETGHHSERYVIALLDYQEAEENLHNAQAAYDAAVAREAGSEKAAESEAAKQAGSSPASANPAVTPAKLQFSAAKDSAQQAKSTSPKTSDGPTGAAAAIAAAGAGAALFASTRKLRRAKHVK